ncbi:MAG: kinase/pyrophosphorylase, partial [Pseudomonadota bacterium]
MSDKIDVFFVSNGTGITSETLGLSLLAQFGSHNFNTRTFPFIDTLERAEFVAGEINACTETSEQRPIVICTFQDTNLLKPIQQTRAMWIDPFGDYLPRLEDALRATHVQPVRSHRAANPAAYDSRIEAVEFSIAHDDGGKSANYDEADIILVGVSRSGKTPSSLYLAIQFGLRAANYPITEEDMAGDRLPVPLREH